MTPFDDTRSTRNLGVTDGARTNVVATALEELANLHMTSLGVLQTGVGAGSTASVNVVGKPWIDEPDGSDSFDFQSGLALPIVSIPPPLVFVELLRFVVPDGYDGVVKGISWNFLGGGFLQFSGDIVVQLLRNGAPIRNYDNMLNERGSLQFPRLVSPIRIFSNQVITMQVAHPSNVLLFGDVVGALAGYFYPNMS